MNHKLRKATPKEARKLRRALRRRKLSDYFEEHNVSALEVWVAIVVIACGIVKVILWIIK